MPLSSSTPAASSPVPGSAIAASVADTLTGLAELARSPYVAGPLCADAWTTAAQHQHATTPVPGGPPPGLAASLSHAARGAGVAWCVATATQIGVQLLLGAGALLARRALSPDAARRPAGRAPSHHHPTRALRAAAASGAASAALTGAAAAAGTAAWRLIGAAGAAATADSPRAVRAAAGAAGGLAAAAVLPPAGARLAAAYALIRSVQACVGQKSVTATPRTWQPRQPVGRTRRLPALPHPGLDGAALAAALAALAAWAAVGTAALPTAHPARLVGILLVSRARPMYGTRSVAVAARVVSAAGENGKTGLIVAPSSLSSTRHPWARAGVGLAVAWLPLYVAASAALPEAVAWLGRRGVGSGLTNTPATTTDRRAAAAARAGRSALAGLAAATAFALVGAGAATISARRRRRRGLLTASPTARRTVAGLAGAAAGLALSAVERRPALAEAGVVAAAAALARAAPGVAWVDAAVLAGCDAALSAWAAQAGGGPYPALSPAPTARLAPLPAAALSAIAGTVSGGVNGIPSSTGGGAFPPPPAARVRGGGGARGSVSDWSLEPGDVLGGGGGESSSSFEDLGRPSPPPQAQPSRFAPPAPPQQAPATIQTTDAGASTADQPRPTPAPPPTGTRRASFDMVPRLADGPGRTEI